MQATGSQGNCMADLGESRKTGVHITTSSDSRTCGINVLPSLHPSTPPSASSQRCQHDHGSLPPFITSVTHSHAPSPLSHLPRLMHPCGHRIACARPPLSRIPARHIPIKHAGQLHLRHFVLQALQRKLLCAICIMALALISDSTRHEA